MNKPIRIYFAAPLFSMAERLWNKEVVTRLRQLGYEVFLPQESEANKRKECNQAVFHSDIDGLGTSDVVFAVMDGPDADSGTCWEHGFGFGIGKTVITLRTDFRLIEKDTHINLMMGESSCDNIYYNGESYDELVKVIDYVIKMEVILDEGNRLG